MRKNLFLWAVFAVMMAFTACTKEKVVYVEKEEGVDNVNGIELKEGEGLIKISLSNGMSRAARPITSNAATNNVNKILFKFVIKDDDTNKDSFFEDFNVDGALNSNGTVVSGTGGTNKNHVLTITDAIKNESTISVKFSGLKEGNYQIYAFGYNNGSGESEIPFNVTFQNTPGETYGTFLCTLKEGDAEVEELFVGVTGTDAYQSVKVNQYGKFKDDITIELKRQVAGLLAYMKNVPKFINDGDGQQQEVKKITVSAWKKTNGLYAPISLYNDDNNQKDFNGYQDKEEFYDLLTFNIPADAGTDSDGYYTFTNYVGAEQNAGYNFNFADGKEPQANTLFGSCFLFSYEKNYSLDDDKGTLNIRYWGGNDSNTLIKSVPLNDGETEDFQLECNHFYAIGHLADWDGDGDGNPDEEGQDNPLPIDEEAGYDNLKVTIVQSWAETIEVGKTELSEN